MRVLITGCNGFVAHYTIMQLLQNNFTVIATAKNAISLNIQHPNLLFVAMDFTNSQQVQKVVAQTQPTHIIHAGAISKPDDCEQNQALAYNINVQGTINVVNAAALYKIQLLFISTDFVFDGVTGNYTETSARSAVNYYGQTKIEAEDIVMAYPNPWCIVRIALVYGKPLSGRDNIITTVNNKLLAGQTYQVFTDQIRTPTYVLDVANVIVTILQLNAVGIYHISGTDIISPYQMAVATANHLGLNSQLIIPATKNTFTQPALRPLITNLNTTKAKNELHFVATSFAKGLAATLS
jgi:dTDP-4-dehydrorhamnose reductase